MKNKASVCQSFHSKADQFAPEVTSSIRRAHPNCTCANPKLTPPRAVPSLPVTALSHDSVLNSKLPAKDQKPRLTTDICLLQSWLYDLGLVTVHSGLSVLICKMGNVSYWEGKLGNPEN